MVDGYNYRSIDDVIVTLSPLLARHRLCVLPRVIERLASKHRSAAGEILSGISLKVAFTFSSARDGSSHIVEAYGEALDAGDKATAKAMSAAYKSAMIQVFCIPVRGSEDADLVSHKVSPHEHASEPPEGWEQWSQGIGDIVTSCETGEAIDLLQNRNRALLKSISHERPELYCELGRAFIQRRQELKPMNGATRLAVIGSQADQTAAG